MTFDTYEEESSEASFSSSERSSSLNSSMVNFNVCGSNKSSTDMDLSPMSFGKLRLNKSRCSLFSSRSSLCNDIFKTTPLFQDTIYTDDRSVYKTKFTKIDRRGFFDDFLSSADSLAQPSENTKYGLINSFLTSYVTRRFENASANLPHRGSVDYTLSGPIYKPLQILTYSLHVEEFKECHKNGTFLAEEFLPGKKVCLYNSNLN